MILRFTRQLRVGLFLTATPMFVNPHLNPLSKPNVRLDFPSPSIFVPLARESTFFTFTLQHEILSQLLDSQQDSLFSLDEYSFEFVEPLVTWLRFDVATKTFSGTPSTADIGFHHLHLRVLRPKLGGNLSKSSPSSLPSLPPSHYLATNSDRMTIPLLVASATGIDAPPEIIQTIPISQQIFQQQQKRKQEIEKSEKEQKEQQEWRQEWGQGKEQKQLQKQDQVSQQKVQLNRRVDLGGSATTASTSTTTNSGIVSSVYEPYADAEVWEGQVNPLRIQLDPQTFLAASSTAAGPSLEEVSPAGPITYYVKTDTSTTLPSWLKFESSTLEFSGTPPIGTYKKTTVLTIVVAASSVPGYIQATDRFSIKVHVHSLGLSTNPKRMCSSSSLYYSQEWDRLWQSYLPDLVLDPQQRHIDYQLSIDLLRVDGCSQPARSAAAAQILAALESNISTATMSYDESLSKSRSSRIQTPYIHRITVALTPETTDELSLTNNTLPSWLSFDHNNWTLSGNIPQGVPTRIVLDVTVVDSFNTSAIFKLQIFSNILPFTFSHPVPDVWVKKGEAFNIDLLIPSLLSYPIEATTLPIEHKFLFEPFDATTQSSPNLAISSNIALTNLSKNRTNPLMSAAERNHSSCTYNDIWGQQSESNREADPSPLVPYWFNRTSFTSALPVSSTSLHSEMGKIVFQGHIPCDLTLRVRWIIRNGLGQFASTEFMLSASDQGPPQVSKFPTDETNGQHHGPIGPIGVKIAVGIAVALPVLIALWFTIVRYCKRLRQDGAIKPAMEGDIEGGRVGTMSNENNSHGLTSKGQRHRQPISEVLPNNEPDYRSSYEDDPSVGHHDSYSEKYVAEHIPHIYTSTTSGDEAEGSGGSKRTSVLGWIFGEKNPGDENSSAVAAEAELERRRMSEPLTFSLKRISVGYPFESSRFGFVNGNRVSLYESGAGTSTDTSSPSVPSQQHNSTELDEKKPLSSPVYVNNKSSESNSRRLSNRTSSIFKKGSKRLSKIIKDKDVINDNVAKRDVSARQLGIDSDYQTVRPCHSFLSTGTGYMASMSECNTSIDEHQDSGRNSDEETEEDKKVNRSNSDRDNQLPWTPSTFLMQPKRLRPKRQTGVVDDVNGECRPASVADLGEHIHRSDSGAVMTESSSMAFSVTLKDSSHISKTLPSIKTTFQDLGRSSSVPLPQQPWLSSLQVPGSENGSSTSLSSIHTAPVTGSEILFIKERQSSAQAGPGAFQRRSIVEFLQSNDDPISPLSAFSASLPSWSHITESSPSFHQDQQDKGKAIATHDNSLLSQAEEALDKSHTLVDKKVSHEITKLMVVPSNQAFRSVSVRRNGNDQKETSQWTSDPVVCEDGVVENTDKIENQNSDDYDERHRSLPYVLGMVDPLPLNKVDPASSMEDGLNSSSIQSSAATTTTDTPLSPRSESVHKYILNQSFSPKSPIQPQLPPIRHSIDRMRPVSYPILAATPVPNAPVPRRFVRATIGTAFHSTSSIRDPMSSSPSSPRLLGYQPSLSRTMSPPPPMSPPLLPMSPILQPMGSPRSSLFGDINVQPLPGEYRAYLVSDPQDVAQMHQDQQRAHRPSASLSSIDVIEQQRASDMVSRPRRKLPEWIQFNSKMRSLWGRPVPGTAGEWQVSMVQTQLVSYPLSCSPATPSSTLSSSAVASTVTDKDYLTLSQQGVDHRAEACLSLESAVEGGEKKEVVDDTGKTEGESLQTQDVEVELVVLMIREPSEIPRSPTLGASVRCRTFPSLAQAQDQVLQQAQEQTIVQPLQSSSSLSFTHPAPLMATPDSPCFTRQGMTPPTATAPSSPMIEVASTGKEMTKTLSVSPMFPASPLSECTGDSVATPVPRASHPQIQESPSSPLINASPGRSRPSSPCPRPSPSGGGRAVGQRVLAERRRIEALMKNQQGL
ncbi:hypothetical protein FBU30_003712 [Linnemannia zychae]|nr:hypothetical protein FBU30_003712 [Linnemannia zychae]